MIDAESVAVILLAAGASTRFGARDKLAEPLDDLPLGLHVAKTLCGLPFLARIVVTRASGPDFNPYGFTAVMNDDVSAGQALSITLGLARAREVDAKAVMIMLADMPFVTLPHVEALLACSTDEHPVVGSTDGDRRSPPVLFRAALFPMLEALKGDMGARALLRTATLIDAPSSELADIDTAADLAAGKADPRRR